MYQKVILVGNLGRDPEMRYLDDGRAVTTFSLAVNFFHEREKKVMWVRVTTFEKVAEQVAQYLKKGRQCLVEGRITPDPETGGPRVYQKKDGSYAAGFDMVAMSVTFLGTRDEESVNVVAKPAAKPAATEPEDEFMVF